MSQVLSEIWASCPSHPLSAWGLPRDSETEQDEWPEFVVDRLAMSETGGGGWQAIDHQDIAPPDVQVVYKQLSLDFNVARRFQHLAERWRTETRYLSSLSKVSMHPAYQQIIGLGRDALPLILQELEQNGGHWLWALHSITGEDPAPLDATFHEAVSAWLEWGRERRLLN